MTHVYETKGVCSRSIEININDNQVIESVKFTGGCGGNTQGIEKLVAGMKASEAIEKVKGILCGSKTTSCPDQLAEALEEAMKLSKNNNTAEQKTVEA